MANFNNINTFGKGESYSFEELVCQLARLETTPDVAQGSIFRRVEGSGGDGGVECYWTEPNGKKIGYQAKYFSSISKAQWRQIKDSIDTALKNHPTLETYVIAFPFDFTKTMSDKWDNKVTSWKLPTTVKVKLWDKSRLIEKLAKPEAEGLIKYFFGDIELTSRYFEDKAEATLSHLGERFSPNDHVDVDAESVFPAISRAQSFKDFFLNDIRKIEMGLRELNKSSSLTKPKSRFSKQLQDALRHVQVIKSQIGLDVQHEWDANIWVGIIRNISKKSTRLRMLIQSKRLRDLLQTGELQATYPKLFSCLSDIEQDNLGNLIGLLSDFRFRLPTQHLHSENASIAFIKGEAGSGKTHLMARAAKTALQQEQPVVFLLGQMFNDGEVWTQISKHFGLTNYLQAEFLGALDAAGKSAGKRTLLLIDGINEGIGAHYWYNHVASLIDNVKKYTHLCCVISCKSEYFDIAIPEHIKEVYPVYKVEGFVTFDEQESAAQIYLDRRHITRPGVPWLVPEFSNPRFLRTVALSLESEGRNDFPLGMIGMKMLFDFYLRRITGYIQQKEGLITSIHKKVEDALDDIADEMLKHQQNFVHQDVARDFIAKRFMHMRANAVDWLHVFLDNGLLRVEDRDYDISEENHALCEKVIRFSYPYFQDFMIAEKVLTRIDNLTNLFYSGGVLEFCLEVKHNSAGEIRKGMFIVPQWLGLLRVVAIATPERFFVELVDLLFFKGPLKNWRDNSEYLVSIITDSIKWRRGDACNDRTLQILNWYLSLSTENNSFDLLIQVTVHSYHPYNADFLHKTLIEKQITDRDVFWTARINWIYEDNKREDATVSLMNWCLHAQTPKTHDETQRLAALTLCWFLSSSNRRVRDNATKALTNIFLYNVNLFPSLLQRFSAIDDLYILERLIAAAYGACCLHPNEVYLRLYASFVFDYIFKENTPPPHLLLRDYALGIIELAEYHSCLPSNVVMETCRPPYNTPKPDLSITEEELNKAIKKAGDDKIYHSVFSSLYSDFAEYVVKPRLAGFVDIVVEQKDDTQHIEKKLIDIDTAKRWIVKRAYDYGWTKSRFGDELYVKHPYARSRMVVERIGKKYQWLALQEILCGLTDNYVIYRDKTCRLYENTTDIIPLRDIDPTILAEDSIKRLDDFKANQWAFKPHIIGTFDSDETLPDWVDNLKITPKKQKELPFRTDANGTKWLVVSEHQSQAEKGGAYSVPISEIFRRMTTLLINLSDIKAILKGIKETGAENIPFSLPHATNRGFFYENPWRGTWDNQQWEKNTYSLPGSTQYAYLASDYSWESHLDASLPHGYKTCVPEPWVAQALKLMPCATTPHQWVDEKGEVVFCAFSNSEGMGNHCDICLLRYDKAEELMRDNDSVFLTLHMTEKLYRFGVPGVWKHVKGTCWWDGQKMNSRSWKYHS